jgi:uncharacterized protein
MDCRCAIGMQFLLLAAFIGVCTGLLSGLMGVGGGIIAVPAMVFLMKLDQHRAHGTSLAVIVVTATASAINYGRSGNVNVPLALELVVGTVIGSFIGARVMNKIPAKELRRAFGALVIVVGFTMIWSGLGF